MTRLLMGDAEMKAQAHLVVRGRVQGVGFRWFVYQEANNLGLVGYVANLSDGGVEVVAEGDKTAVEALIRLLRRGPAFSEVTEVDIDWLESFQEYKTFEIRH